MKLLAETSCPYCDSRIDLENILELENPHFYVTCSECKKTFKVFVKLKAEVNGSSIEEEIKRVKDNLNFWEQANMNNKEFKNYRIAEHKKMIQELERFKERNDKEEDLWKQ